MKKMLRLFVVLMSLLMLVKPFSVSAETRDLTLEEEFVLMVLEDSIGEDFRVEIYIDEDDKSMFALVPSTPESQLVFLMFLAGHQHKEWDNMRESLLESSILLFEMFESTLAVTIPLNEDEEVDKDTELIALFWNGFTVVDSIDRDNEDTKIFK